MVILQVCLSKEWRNKMKAFHFLFNLNKLKKYEIKILLISLVFLSACQRKVNEIPSHEAGKRNNTIQADLNKSEDEKIESNEFIQKLNKSNYTDKINSINKKANLSESDYSELKSMYSDLSNDLLNNAVLYSSSEKTKASFRYGLYYFNKIVLAMLNFDKFKTNDIKSYLNVLTESCDSELFGCKNIRLFSTDPGTHQIFLNLAENLMKNNSNIVTVNNKNEFTYICSEKKTVIGQYYCLLFLAYETKSQVYNEKLSLAFLRHGSKYLSELDKDTDSNKIERFKKIYQTILLTFNGANQNEELKKLIFTLQPWMSSIQRMADFKNSTSKMMSLITKDFFYKDKEGKQLNEALTKAISEIQSNKDNLGLSFKSSLEEKLKIENTKEIFESLGLPISEVLNKDFYNEYFYIIDRWYRGHASIEVTEASYLNTNRDAKKLFNSIKLYSRAVIIDLLLETQNKIKELIADPTIYKNNMLQILNDRTKSLTERWKFAINQFNDMIVLVRGLSAKSYNVSLSELESTEINLANFRSEIRSLLVGPSMIMTSFFYAKNNLEIKISRGFEGSSKQASKDAINELFSDTSSRSNLWFDFGNDLEGLKSTETLVAFIYTLQTKMFDAFGGNEFKSNFIESEFVPTRTKLLELYQDKLFTDEKTKFNEIKSEKDKVESKQMEYCSYLKSKNNDFTIDMNIEDLHKSTGLAYFWTDTTGPIYQAYLKIGAKIDKTDNSEAINILVGQYRKKVTLFNIVLKLFEQEASSILKDNPNKLKIYLNKINNLKIETLKLGQDFVKTVMQIQNEVADCIDLFSDLEFQRQFELISKEDIYLRSLYKDLKAVVENKTNSSQMLINLAKKYKFEEYGESFDKNTYTYTRNGLILRTAHRLATEFKPSVKIDGSVDLTSPFFKTNVKTDVFLFNSGRLKTEDEFVNQILGTLTKSNRNNDKLINWFNYQDIKTLMQAKAITSLSLWGFQKLDPIYFVDDFNKILKNQAVTNQKMVSDWIKLSKYHSINKTEFYWFQKLNIFLKSNTGVVDVFYNRSASSQYYLFDNAFKKVLEVADVTDAASDLYKHIGFKKQSNFTLQYDSLDQLVKSYSEDISKYFKIIDDFAAAVNENIKSYKNKLHFNVNNVAMNPTEIISIQSNEFTNYIFNFDESGNYIVLDQKLIQRKKAEMEDYKKLKTSGFYELK